MGVYEELGVIPIVNAAGTVTRYGGSLMDHDVIDVMREASQQFCLLDELQERAGIRIAEMLDVEAAYVTSSAACGLVLTAAACMAGSDPERISQLPDASGLKDEIIIQEAHRMPYDQSIRLSGAKLIQVGEGKAGPEQEMKSAINAQTAAVFYLANKMDDSSAVSFEDTIKIAHEALVPVIVDAASEAPPISTLSRFTRAGADLVIFSGGKSIRGPQSTGLVVGRTDLIAAIAANGVPFATIGRPMKVSREEIIAFIKALDLFLHRDHDADLNVWDNQLKHIETALASTEGVSLRRFTKGETYHVPLLALEFAEGTSASIEEIHDALLAGAPRIAVATHLVPGSLVVNPHSLQPGQERIVAERLKAVIEAIN
jgi:uncharacterized pyridoxal phosphate-dependent enzyme